MWRKKKLLVTFIGIITIITVSVIQSVYGQSSHTLIGNPKTVHWGYYSGKIEPALKIDPGDIVTIVSPHGVAAVYEAGGIPPDQISKELRDINREVKERGPGPHILTGPIYINGVAPGDILEVHIKDVKPTKPYGYNTNWYGMGTLPEDFPFTAWRVPRLDLKNMTSEIMSGVVIPLKPFFGNMGVAPPDVMGKISSAPPGIQGGNLDIKELVAGTILYLPVHVKGALFSVGDGHAAQGDGEVCLTGIEVAEMTGTFQFFVRKNKRLVWPRAETPTHFITVGLNEDLDVAAKMALREMINFLNEEKGISRENAYYLSSVAVDLRVAQLVNGVKGIYAMLPKNIFVKK